MKRKIIDASPDQSPLPPDKKARGSSDPTTSTILAQVKALFPKGRWALPRALTRAALSQLDLAKTLIMYKLDGKHCCVHYSGGCGYYVDLNVDLVVPIEPSISLPADSKIQEFTLDGELMAD